jgi:AcrR family transcriptional regulator
MPADSVSGPVTEIPNAERVLRRDAAENRKRLLKAADEVFAESGFGATMDEIAARAGVGVGTAYRRFANKDEIIGALFDDRIAALVAVVDRALEQADPWQGIVTFFEGSVSALAGDRGLRELALSSPRGQEYAAEARRLLRPKTERLVARAHRAGCLRPGIVASDLVIVQLMLSTVLGHVEGGDTQLWRRFLPLVIDGLRPECSTPLPGDALTPAQLAAVMTAGAARRSSK